MRIRISNFKSIDSVELELAPLTLLIGPPASGKSNILDAIAFIGYFNRFLLLDKEYNNNALNLEPLTVVTRFSDVTQLFRFSDLSRRINIEIGDSIPIKLSLYFESGKPCISINDTSIPWDLRTLASGPMQNVRDVLSTATKGALIESRLYGYDRYGLALQSCTSMLSCGFYARLRGGQSLSTPRNILSELGWNAQFLTKRVSDVVTRLNMVTAKNLGEKIEVKVLRDGSITIFDYDVEIVTFTVSDSILRALYYLMALRTAVNYAKIYGLEHKFIILLEEPEAHLFPFFLDLLAEYIAKSINTTYVVVTTHNPLLVSILNDKVKDIKTYYTIRDEEGSTKVYEIDVEKLAKDIVTFEDLLFLSPREVLEKYVVTQRYS